MGKLYGLLVQTPNQEDVVKEHCFGDCGKISIGGAIMTGAGLMMMCCHNDCPHVGEQTDEPIGNSEMTGEPIYLRALTPNCNVTGAEPVGVASGGRSGSAATRTETEKGAT